MRDFADMETLSTSGRDALCTPSRAHLSAAKRLVIKVGTSSITYENGHKNLANIERLCRAIADQMNQDREVILVTSGAIAVGMSKLHVTRRAVDMREKQAFAAIGQCDLMDIYSRTLAQFGYVVGQILLTRDDVDDSIVLHNIKNTFEALIERRVVPIVNENDTVSTKEVSHNGTFGDNDALSAIVARIVDADLLILLSDIDGLYDSDPRTNEYACLISDVSALTPEIASGAGRTGSWRGKGGMISKIAAASIAMEAGIDMVISNGARPHEIQNILDGEPIGTLFRRNGSVY